jgi:hypothetical protein
MAAESSTRRTTIGVTAQQAPWVYLSAPVAACPLQRIGALPSALEPSTSLLSVKMPFPWPTVVRRLRQAGAVIDGSALVCSIRIPAGFCGLYGLKPSAGIVSLTAPGWAEIAPLLPTSGRPGRR